MIKRIVVRLATCTLVFVGFAGGYPVWNSWRWILIIGGLMCVEEVGAWIERGEEVLYED